MIDDELIKGYECGDWIERYDPSGEQGDWVVVIDKLWPLTKDEYKFKGSMNPSWVWEAYGQVGEVIGEYHNRQRGIHYAIRFPLLKKVFPLHHWFFRKATEEEVLRTRLKKVEDRLPELKGMF